MIIAVIAIWIILKSISDHIKQSQVRLEKENSTSEKCEKFSFRTHPREKQILQEEKE